MKRRAPLLLFRQNLMIFLTLLAAVLGLPAQAQNSGYYDLAQPKMLISAPQLTDPRYNQTVVFVFPVVAPQVEHAGFVLNWPTSATLGELFPKHVPSQKIPGKVHYGGPFSANAIFAIAEMKDGLASGLSLELIGNVHLIINAGAIDQLIELQAARLEKKEVLKKPAEGNIGQSDGVFAGKEVGDVRYFNGDILWKPGELEEEIRRGLWYVQDVDPKLFFGNENEGGLWKKQLQKARMKEKTV